MSSSLRIGDPGLNSKCRAVGSSILWATGLAMALTPLAGCGHAVPAATVEGTLQCQGQPLDHCLVTFLPAAGSDAGGRHATGLTDQRGAYRLQFDDQQEGATIGWNCVTIQDLTMSTGVRRRDNGTVDADVQDTSPPPTARPSRVPESYMSLTRTPLRKEVKPGHQVIDLEIK